MDDRREIPVKDNILSFEKTERLGWYEKSLKISVIKERDFMKSERVEFVDSGPVKDNSVPRPTCTGTFEGDYGNLPNPL